ncbi:MAG TPA: serine/threonine-protein kinase, partial [Acidimicrobiales bacterium]|nr:serine/threonine-protein kinase [Acidimicrobiales bacterium]
MSDIDLGINGISDVEEVGRTPAYTTYQVRDTGTGQQALIKVVHAAGRPQSSVDRFSQEQAVLTELATHPNLVSVLGNSTTAGGEPFVVTELTPGTTVADRFGATPPMTGPEVLRLGIRAAGALESVHRGGVLHGDLRAENIALSNTGDPLVNDVGLAPLTGTSVAQTDDPSRLEHASPELLDGQYATPATDQYSLAATLYHLLAGEAAFVRSGETSVVPVIKRIATDPPPDLKALGVPPAVADVVHKALSKNPGDRHPNMQAFARALQQAEVALGLPVTDLTVMTPATQLPTAWAAAAPTVPTPAAVPPPAAAPPPAPATAGGGRSRTPLFVGIGVLVVVVLIAAVLLTRGGSGKKNVAASSSTSSSSSSSGQSKSTGTSATGSATASSTDFAPAGFITVNHSFDHGDLEVFVPKGFTQSDPVQLQNGEPRLRVAPDVAAFQDGTFTRPGVQIDAFGVATNGVSNADNLDALLDNFDHQPAANGGWPGGP